MVYLENSLLEQDVWISRSVTNGYITSSPFITEAELEEALADYPTTEEVEAMVSGAVNTGLVQTMIDDSLVPYWTSAQTNSAITDATSAFTTTGDVADMISAFTTTGDVQTQIDLSLLPYWTSAQTNSAITDATSAFTTTGDVQTQIDLSLLPYWTSGQTTGWVSDQGYQTENDVNGKIHYWIVDDFTEIENPEVGEMAALKDRDGFLYNVYLNGQYGINDRELFEFRYNNVTKKVYAYDDENSFGFYFNDDDGFIHYKVSYPILDKATEMLDAYSMLSGLMGESKSGLIIGPRVYPVEFRITNYSNGGFTVQFGPISSEVTMTNTFQPLGESDDIYEQDIYYQPRYPYFFNEEHKWSYNPQGFATTDDLSTRPTYSQVEGFVGWKLEDYYDKDEVNALISGLTPGGVTTGDVQTMIDNSLTEYWTSAATENAITAATSGFTTSGDVNTQISTSLIPYWTSAQTTGWVNDQHYLTEHQSLSAYSTTDEVENMITAATSAFTTTGDVQTQIDLSLIPYWTSAQTNSAITSATSGMATEQWVQNQGYLTEHQSLSAYSTTDEVENMITAATSGFTTSGDVNTQIGTSLIPYWTSAQTNSAITSATENMATTGTVENMITAATSAFTTSAQVQSQITSALTGYNPTDNFKTINGESIIGTGDITIQGGGSNVSWNQITTAGTKIAEVTINSATTDVYAPNGGGGGEQVVELTQAQYLALTAYSENTTYVITDADYIDMDQYYTSGETNAAISAATSGKQDSITTTANSSNRNFPLWNANGQITGKTGNNVSSVGFSVNGSNQTGILRDNSSSNLTGIYAPTSAGSNGNLLRSTGSGAPSWASPSTLNLVESTTLRNVVICSQTDYDNMSAHSATVLYIISD